jgi:hypothetical protein
MVKSKSFIKGKHAKLEVRKDGSFEHILYVETKIELEPDDDGYDGHKVDQLVAEVVALLEPYDRAVIYRKSDM